MLEWYTHNVFFVTTLLAASASSLLFGKYLIKKEPSIIGAILSRVALAIIYLMHIDRVSIYPFISLGITVLLLSDILSNVQYLTSRKYLKEIERSNLLTTINYLLGKIATIIDNPYIGFYTIDETGRIEFANSKLCSILGSNDLMGKNLFDYLDTDIVSRIKSEGNIHEECNLHLKTPSEKVLKVKLTAATTVNGHRTITGSIIE